MASTTDRYKAPHWEITRRSASIVGRVIDTETTLPLGGAMVLITAGPEAFQRQVAALDADPAWSRQEMRLDRRVCAADGSFVFMDLPNGKYMLNISAPHLGKRYGEDTPQVTVPAPDKQRVKEHGLRSTCIRGVVKGEIDGKTQPVAKAVVRLHGGSAVLTNSMGEYVFSGLLLGKAKVEAWAEGFQKVSGSVELEKAGERKELNLTLKPEDSSAKAGTRA